ncbi:MAG: alpha/beta fold hydrolase [Clostridia bacterium]|nr:alpha/beta fold hydrolase [Clostridia bacterium]
MANIENFTFPSSYNERPVAGYIATCADVKPRAIFQITHGMAEHWMRYAPFAGFLAQRGYVVCGHDDLGHGQTSADEYPDGFFAPKDGDQHVVNDIHKMTSLAKESYPGLPLILFGHSMGSFFARWACELWHDEIYAAIYCGTGGANPAAAAGMALTALLSAISGPEHKSKLVDRLAFGAYQKRIPRPRTNFDWLSANEENVDKYIRDPKCGFLFSVGAFHDMMKVMRHVNSEQWSLSIRKDMPILIIAGEEDPVGNYGKGPREVAEGLKSREVHSVDIKLYPKMRHEILNEADRQTVWEDILLWCDKRINDAARA